MEGKYLINDKEYVLTKHALQRAKKRDIKEEELLEAINNPRSDRPRLGVKNVFQLFGYNNLIITYKYDKDTIVIVTLFKFNRDYARAKTKNRKNKNRLKNKRKFGNRLKH